MATMGSMGGKPILEALVWCFVPNAGPNEMMQPGFVWWSSVQCSIFYYFTSHFYGLLQPEEARALLCLLLISHSILATAAGRAFDFTLPIRKLTMFVANLPDPEAKSTPDATEAKTSPNGKESKKKR